MIPPLNHEEAIQRAWANRCALQYGPEETLNYRSRHLIQAEKHAFCIGYGTALKDLGVEDTNPETTLKGKEL